MPTNRAKPRPSTAPAATGCECDVNAEENAAGGGGAHTKLPPHRADSTNATAGEDTNLPEAERYNSTNANGEPGRDDEDTDSPGHASTRRDDPVGNLRKRA